jgi:hypothetical protein
MEAVENTQGGGAARPPGMGPVVELPAKGGPPVKGGRGGRGGHRQSLMKRMVDTTALDTRFESKAERILLRLQLYNVLTSLLWEVKAVSVMLVGVGVKLAIYNPTASPTAHFAAAQRLLSGLPLGLCFSVQLFHTVFVKTRHHYSLRTLLENKLHSLVLLTRIALLLFCPLVVFIEIGPLYLLVVLAAASVAQCILLQIHDYKAAIKSTKLHPLRELPNALLALQHKRKRAYDAANPPQPSTPVRKLVPKTVPVAPTNAAEPNPALAKV